MILVDTHCHIHESELFPGMTGIEAAARAVTTGVTKLLCVGTSQKSSREAVIFAAAHSECYALIGVHPHDAKDGISEIELILQQDNEKIIGIGEIGLDYYYDNSPRNEQIKAFEQQLQWAHDYHLPVSFHVRDSVAVGKHSSVWDDFWPIIANFPNISGVLHSFTDTMIQLEQALERGFYIGVNGISTFAHDKQAVFDAIPLEKMVLETDAPFLTPVPHRGKVNEPAFVRNVAEYHAKRREVELEHLARVTSANASSLFSI